MKISTIWIIVGCIVSLIIVPVIVYSALSAHEASTAPKLTNNPPERTNDEVSHAIAMSNAYLHTSDNEPTFKLMKVKRLANNWYMAWIDNKQIKVLINDPAVNSDRMRVILGPATEFDSSSVYSEGIPSSVYGVFVNARYN